MFIPAIIAHPPHFVNTLYIRHCRLVPGAGPVEPRRLLGLRQPPLCRRCGMPLCDRQPVAGQAPTARHSRSVWTAVASVPLWNAMRSSLPKSRIRPHHDFPSSILAHPRPATPPFPLDNSPHPPYSLDMQANGLPPAKTGCENIPFYPSAARCIRLASGS